jgi:hypothetical protein
MKRFWLMLLVLGLVVSSHVNAMAVDVKVSGEYYVGGMYLDKIALKKDADYPSTAFYFQRLRMTTQFVVTPGLSLNVRADVMERSWGANRSTASTTLDTLSAGTRAENENIAFDLLYVSYKSPIGIFNVGYQIDGAWGTVFGDNSTPTGKIVYMFVNGGLTVGLQVGKYNGGENSYSAINTSADGSDRDNNFYTAYVKYAWKAGDAGILFKWNDLRSNRNKNGGLDGYKAQYLSTLPYARMKVGPVFVQTEAVWVYGKSVIAEDGASNITTDVKYNQLAFWLDATADFGKGYAGGTFAYLSGDDPSTPDKKEGNASGGLDWNPCLILFNSDLSYWVGSQAGYNETTTYGINTGGMNNAWFFQLRGGVRPIDKLDIMASVSYANAVVKPTTSWLYNDYGYEVDLTATYKITNNLSYVLGGGYLFTGKYFKGTLDSNEVRNEYLVINKLTLTF